MSDKAVVIVAPHPDDEIIGCFEIVSNFKTMIIYDAETPHERRMEALNLKNKFNIAMQVFMKSVPPPWLSIDTSFLFPDPIYEVHPLHRHWGQIGESLARNGKNVIFYNTIMNAPYIHELRNPEEKRRMLDEYYKSQSDLWMLDHKYFLFEGYNSWKFNILEAL